MIISRFSWTMLGTILWTVSRTVLVTISGTFFWNNLRTTIFTSYNGTHSLYQHISGIKNGHDESGPGKPYDISCATLRTFNINICVSFLLFIHPTLNAGLVNPFCCTTASENKNRQTWFNFQKLFFRQNISLCPGI